MIRRSEYFETIDKYLNNELTEPELSEFELELKLNPDLAEEMNLQLDVQEAIQEQDIISLRENLNKITTNQAVAEKANEFSYSDSFNFGLAEELSSATNFSRPVNTEDIISFSHSFPKIHLYQQKIAAKENIHQFYKEQHESDSLNEEESYSPMEDALFEDIKNALEENDVLDIRANLKQIAASMPDHSRSTEEMYNYIYDLMDCEQRAEFEEELEFNASLANDVQLFQEIDLASAENDIMELRASLQQIQKSELQSTSRIEEIEGYIYDELTEAEMASFEAELADNKELYAEIDLVKNIDKALRENDIMKLREKLGNIADNNRKEKQSERSIAFKFSHRKIAISAVAASLILLLSITGLLSRYSSGKNVYQKFYAKYETTGISRSSNTLANQTLAIALQKFNNQDYESALNLLQEVISRDMDNTVGHFYAGASLQELGKYQNAIKEYQAVVIQKDNLFIEQAEWYIGLCYLQTNENKKAIKQFKKIANQKGFYQQEATVVLRKLKTVN
jgi:hypothetical protein